MSRPVTYRIHERPDGCFDIHAAILGGKRFRRSGLRTWAEAEACVAMLADLMEGCGAALLPEASPALAFIPEERSSHIH